MEDTEVCGYECGACALHRTRRTWRTWLSAAKQSWRSSSTTRPARSYAASAPCAEHGARQDGTEMLMAVLPLGAVTFEIAGRVAVATKLNLIAKLCFLKQLLPCTGSQ